ncbi:ribosomal s21 [Fusarium albosuccineum]|uniref:Ribosomal s21 n=1 Tax=Fusarium albosuccineum TaxID=1237068 RepID=A0A8H4LH52_9HYPO|nr:ribosomal s21 [Fusarium albosuccineum]
MWGRCRWTHISPPYRTYIFPTSRLFTLLSGFDLDDDSQLGVYVGVCRKMAAPSRFGGSMLSRVAPSPFTRAFSTSLAFRAGPSDDAPRRTNPLIGNITRTPETKTQTPERAQPAPSPRTPWADASKGPRTQASDLPPPPPPAKAPEAEPKPTEKFPYTASTTSSKSIIDIAALVASKASAFGDSVAASPIERPQIRAKPVTGRTVFIKDRMSSTSGPTPTVALRILSRIIREDQVKNKYHSQKFHERKGLKKKRLRSQRWRSRFKHGFKATVTRVIELKRQGW